MKKNLTELVFILDRSGSMAGLEKDTIGGFNAMIARQRDAEGDALVSTVLFSNDSKVIHDRIDVRRVEPLTERQYIACGCTALLDAIDKAKAKAFFEAKEGVKLIPPKVNMKMDQLLRLFIISGGSEVDIP